MLFAILSLAVLLGAVPSVVPLASRAAAATAASGPIRLPDLRVMTWNVKTGENLGLNNPFDTQTEKWAKVIGNQKPDIVALQEVCMDDVPRLLTHLDADYDLDYHWAAGGVRRAENGGAPYLGCHPFDDRQYGQAILSRFPVSSTTTRYSDVGPGNEARGFMSARVTLAGGGFTLPVYDTHLGFGATQDSQVKELVAASQGNERALVLGDFNLEPSSPALQRFATAGFREVDEADDQPTIPNGEAPATAKIDHIFQRGFVNRSRPQVYRTAVSDHRPLIVDLGFRNAEIPTF